MLLERLYQTETVPPKTPRETVRRMERLLCARLYEKLSTPYTWSAVAYQAVMAGNWGGERRLRQRRKLLRLIQVCQRYCGVPILTLPAGWERQGLYFGFDAVRSLAQDLRASPEEIIMMGVVLHPPKRCQGGVS